MKINHCPLDNKHDGRKVDCLLAKGSDWLKGFERRISITVSREAIHNFSKEGIWAMFWLRAKFLRQCPSAWKDIAITGPDGLTKAIEDSSLAYDPLEGEVFLRFQAPWLNPKQDARFFVYWQARLSLFP